MTARSNLLMFIKFSATVKLYAKRCKVACQMQSLLPFA
jgi:hypothetical protein